MALDEKSQKTYLSRDSLSSPETKIYYPPIEPHSVKDSEKSCINSTYINITRNKIDNPSAVFKPVEGVPYLWVYTEANELILGIEEPWKYPEAFIDTDDVIQVNAFKEISAQLQLGHERGHPTLSAIFDSNGEALAEKGRAYIGGELNFINNQWQLSNRSGRFGHRFGHPAIIQYHMYEVTQKFKEITNIQASFIVSTKKDTYLHDYYQCWATGNNELEATHNLLANYLTIFTSNELQNSFLKNKYLPLVKEALASLRSDNDYTVNDLLHFFKENVNMKEANDHDDLIRRLRFIAGQTNNDFYLGEIHFTDNNTNPAH